MARDLLSVAIPTYGRDGVLIDTLHRLLAMTEGPAEILVLDQSERHDAAATAELARLSEVGSIRWIRLPRPSIPAAMNAALREAAHEVVLFVDDDVVPDPALIRVHAERHRGVVPVLIAGRVIQPWQALSDETDRSPRETDVFIGCNFSLKRRTAIAIGGFDENFVRVAYNFEREFAHRWRAAGGRVVYQPSAVLHHLKVPAGGTRSFGHHLTTIMPAHAVGAYYHLLRTWAGWPSLREFLRRPVRAIATRHHLRRPWWIPVTLCAEIGGMIWAVQLALRGPALINPETR